MCTHIMHFEKNINNIKYSSTHTHTHTYILLKMMKREGRNLYNFILCSKI